MLAVTTQAPLSRADRISARAGSMPPITSMTTSTSSRATSAGRVGGQQPVGHVDLAGRVEAAYGDADQLDRRADPGREVTGLLLEQADHLGADRPAAEDGDLEGRVGTFSGTFPCRSPTGRPQSRAGRSTRATPSRTATTGGRSAWL